MSRNFTEIVVITMKDIFMYKQCIGLVDTGNVIYVTIQIYSVLEICYIQYKQTSAISSFHWSCRIFHRCLSYNAAHSEGHVVLWLYKIPISPTLPAEWREW